MTAEPTEVPAECPQCGGTTVPIVYGLPGGDLFEQADRGEVALGGCVVRPDMPRRRCSACGRDVGDAPEDPSSSLPG